MKTIKICSKNYKLRFNEKAGANFDCEKKIIRIGKGDTEDRAAYIIHEVLEAILTEDCKRFYNYDNSHDDPNFLFMFDHDYLCELQHKILEALLTSKFFKLRKAYANTHKQTQG